MCEELICFQPASFYGQDLPGKMCVQKTQRPSTAVVGTLCSCLARVSPTAIFLEKSITKKDSLRVAQFKLPSTVSAYICIITRWVSRVSSVRAISEGTVSTADMPSMTMHESLEWPFRAHPLPKAVNHHGCTATVIPRDIVLLVFTMSLDTADSVPLN